MRLILKVFLSLGMLALCLWLVWPSASEKTELIATFRLLTWTSFWPYLTGYLSLLAATHFFRAWRFNNLLAPIKVHLPPGQLLSISSIGFMAILALPFRLGEFARPALVRKATNVSMSSVLGAVAVERIVDGLVISVMFSTCVMVLHNDQTRAGIILAAIVAFAVFVAALVFLVLAMRWRTPTIKFAVLCTTTPFWAPRFADKLGHFLDAVIDGFKILHDRKNFAMMLVWTCLYWGVNGMSMWTLAQGFGLDLSVVGAYATMGIIALGITLPNSPGLVGQFQALTLAGLQISLAESVTRSAGLGYAIALHGIQVVWYVGWGALAMLVGQTKMTDLFGPSSQSPSS